MSVADAINRFHPWRRRHRIIPAARRRAAAARRMVGLHRTPLTANERRIAAFRDKHVGQPAFLLGNGPSLCVADLDRLHARRALTFASNKVYLAFDQTPWRPTYYIVADILVAENNADAIGSLPLTKFFGDACRPYFRGRSDILWLNELPAYTGPRDDGKLLFSTDAVYGVHGGYTVLYHQLQLAFYMGVREVYLVGVDFSFQHDAPTGEVSDHGPVLLGQGEVNHFHPDYRKPGERWTVPRLDLQYRAFQMARDAYEQHGGKIYNASRRTQLDVFERVDLDEV